MHEQSRQFERQGASLDDYLKSIDKTEEQLHEELHPVATKRLTRSLVLGKFAETEKVEVDDKEIDNEIERMLQNAADNREGLQKAFNSPQSRDSLRQVLLTRKTIDRLLEIAEDKKEKKTKQKKEVEKE
jgi:trigger factor